MRAIVSQCLDPTPDVARHFAFAVYRDALTAALKWQHIRIPQRKLQLQSVQVERYVLYTAAYSNSWVTRVRSDSKEEQSNKGSVQARTDS